MHYYRAFQQKNLNQFHFSVLTAEEKCPPLTGREAPRVPSTCYHLSTQHGRDRHMDSNPLLCKICLVSQQFMDSETAPLTFSPRPMICSSGNI